MHMIFSVVGLLLCACSAVNGNNLRVVQQQRDLQSEVVFVAQNGLVVMEAESVPVVAPWKLESTIAGYNGTGYFRFDGNTVSSGTPLGMLSYKFQIDIPGTYHLRMKARKNSTTWSNDCYTKIVGHPGFRGDTVRSALTGQVKPNIWATRLDHIYGNPFIFEIPTYQLSTAGVYELQVFGRTKHFIIDRIMVFNQNTVTETFARDAKRTESPRLGATVPTTPVASPTAVPPTMPPALPPKLPKIILNLVTARLDPDTKIQELVGGDVFSRTDVGTLISIEASCPEVPVISKITFYYNTNISVVETAAPYLMAGNNGSKNIAVNYLKTTGAKTVSVKVYDNNNDVVAERIIDFTIIA